jgi:hypothetical protein
LVDTASAITLLISAKGPEHNHSQQPSRVSPRDGENDQGNDVVNPARQQEAKRDERSEHDRAGDATNDRADQDRAAAW